MRCMKRLGLIAVLAVVVSGCAASLPKTHAEYPAVSSRMTLLVVMPPEFSVDQVGSNLIGMYTPETLTELNHDVELELQAAVARVLSASRIKPMTLVPSDSMLAADPELHERLLAAQKARDRAYQDVVATKGKSINVSFASDLDYFADRAKGEQLLIVGGSGWFKTSGTRTMEILLGSGTAGSQTTLRAMLVDANLGKVLWYNEVTRAQSDPRKPSHLEKSAAKLLEPLTGTLQLSYDDSRDAAMLKRFDDLRKRR